MTASEPLEVDTVGAAGWVALVVGRGLFHGANTRDPTLVAAARRYAFGHGLAQAAVATLVGWIGVARYLGAVGQPTVSWGVGAVLGLAALAMAIGAELAFVTYLGLANAHRRVHDNTIYSEAHWADCRHFLRFRLTPDGTLTMFAIGVEHVPDLEQRVRDGIEPDELLHLLGPVLVKTEEFGSPAHESTGGAAQKGDEG